MTTKPLKILNLKDLKRELYKCYKCDCATFPVCVDVLGCGDLCNECFDIAKYNHKLPCRSQPGRFKIADLPQPQQIIKKASIKVSKMPPDGDCLYNAVREALKNGITVDDLRYLVSKKQSIESFRAYRTLAEWKMAEFSAIKGAKTLREFKNVIQKSGRRVGASRCVWGDENAMRILANAFHIGLLIFNEKGALIQTIKPEFSTAKRFVLLRLNNTYPGNEHYDLLIFNNHKLLTHLELSKLNELLNSR